MTNQSPESVIAEVIEYHADAIDTHGPGCYKNHAACLAVKLRDMLREPGVPDAPRRAVRELIAEARGFWGSETREYAGGLVSRLADALEAATHVPVQGEPNDDREEILRKALEHVREVGESGLAGPYVHDLPKDVDSNWGWLQTMWPVVVAVDIALASRTTVPDAALAEAKKQLGEIQRHFTAIAGSGEIRVYEDTGEKHGIDYQSSVWAKRGERMTRDLIEFLCEHHRPEPVGNGESK